MILARRGIRRSADRQSVAILHRRLARRRGVIIDAELEGTEILFHLLSSHSVRLSDRQNRTEEEKRPLECEWSGTGSPEEKKVRYRRRTSH